MIQRIQSIFLFCTAVVAVLMFFMPVATILVPGEGMYDFYTTKLVLTGEQPEVIMHNWSSLILNVLIAVLALLTIFVRKPKAKSMRPSLLLKLRWCAVNIVLQLGMVALMWIQVHQAAKAVNAEWNANISFVFPVVGVIFTWLAVRYIFKDIALLSSYDRIR